MNLIELKEKLGEIDNLIFRKENGDLIEPHFHITEIGLITKLFVDCGGKTSSDNWISLQLWHSDKDKEHRLSPSKLLSIINSATFLVGLETIDVQIQYQNDTIGLYSLDYLDDKFILKSTETACLAEDKCIVELPIVNKSGCCGGGCGC